MYVIPSSVQAYLSQGHSGCTARDFVVMVVHEGHEGEEFWQWFELQVSSRVHMKHTGRFVFSHLKVC